MLTVAVTVGNTYSEAACCSLLQGLSAGGLGSGLVTTAGMRDLLLTFED